MSYFKQKSWKRSIVLFCKSCDSAQQLWAYFYLSRLNMEASTLFGFSPKLRPKKIKKNHKIFNSPCGCSSRPLTRFIPKTPPTTAPEPRASAPISNMRDNLKKSYIMHLIQIMDPSLILTSASCSWRCPGGRIWIGWCPQLCPGMTQSIYDVYNTYI